MIRKPTSSETAEDSLPSPFCSVRQLVRDDFREPPFTAMTVLPRSVFPGRETGVEVHSRQFPHMSIAPQAARVFGYASTGVVPFFFSAVEIRILRHMSGGNHRTTLCDEKKGALRFVAEFPPGTSGRVKAPPGRQPLLFPPVQGRSRLFCCFGREIGPALCRLRVSPAGVYAGGHRVLRRVSERMRPARASAMPHDAGSVIRSCRISTAVMTVTTGTR